MIISHVDHVNKNKGITSTLTRADDAFGVAYVFGIEYTSGNADD